MKKINKKAFTIIELVIVIAVIAILAAVLIPTFSNLIEKANRNNDISMVRQMNTVLSTDPINKNVTFTDVASELEEAGINVEKITNPYTSDCKYAWNYKDNKMVLIEQGTNKLVEPQGEGDEVVNKEEYYVIISSNEEATKWEGYSYALSEKFSEDSFSFNAGLDAFKNNSVKTLTYTNSKQNKEVVIKTNGGDLVVNGAKGDNGDTIHHYGKLNNVVINSVGNHSYNENGEVTGEAIIKTGKIAISEASKITKLVIPTEATNEVKVENKGHILVVDIKDAKVALDITNSGTITSSIASNVQKDAIKGTKPTNNFENVKLLTSDTHEITEGGYYAGNGVEISSTGTTLDSRFGITIKTNEKVIIDNVTFTGLRGILFKYLDSIVNSTNVTVINSKFNVSDRGIQVWYENNEENDGVILNVINSNFANTLVSNYDTELRNATTSGILVNGTKNFNLTIENSTIYGFDYSISANYRDNAYNVGTNINVKNSSFKARSALQGLSIINSNISFENSKLHGINIFSGTTEDFGNIIICGIGDSNNNKENSGNTINITDCEFTIYRSQASQYNGQSAIEIRSENNTINLKGNNTVIADVHYTQDSTLPESTSDIGKEVIYYKETKKPTINGTFTSAIYNAIKGNKVNSLNWI